MSGKNKSKSGGAQLYDRLLIPRLENYGSNNDISDVDECVEYLRRNYKEYQRHKIGPFKHQVARAVDTIIKKGGVNKVELRLQSIEDRHIQNRARQSGGESSTSSEDGAGQEDSDSDNDLAIEVVGSMNKSMANLYANDSAAQVAIGAQQPEGDAGQQQQQQAAVAMDTAVPKSEQQQPSTSGKAGRPTPAIKRTGSARADRGGEKRPRTTRLLSSATKPSSVTYADLGGIDTILADVKELIEFPLRHPEVYCWLGVEPPRGVLLHGPPGCGKTALANAIANECGVPFFRVSAPEIVSGMSGESEAKVRQLFQEAAAVAPCIIFIDEIDAIAPKRENAQREMERRIVAQMLTCMDDLSALYVREEQDSEAAADAPLQTKHVVVIGATNRPDALDPALRRAGRFDREISLNIPGEEARKAILSVVLRKLRLSGDFDLSIIAKKTPGFVGADLAALTKEAAALAVNRIFKQLEDIEKEAPAAAVAVEEDTLTISKPKHHEPLTPHQLTDLAITMDDFEQAVGKVQPSVRREGFATTPGVTWDDVGSLGDVREELSFAITRPIRQPELFEALGLRASTGVLLFGPPGCGKTLVAKAAANDSGANFISIKGPELLNKYVGESERAVRQLFSRARAASPCVLFFDEMDALAPKRGSDAGNQSAERLVNQLLTEMDGVDERQGVFVVAATNRPDIIDPALLRPGRLDRILYVPLPTPEGRVAILQALTRKTPLGLDVDLTTVGMADSLTGFSGADLASLVREACVEALKERLLEVEQGGVVMTTPEVNTCHFLSAMRRVQPSVSRKDQRMYDALRTKLRSSRGRLRPEEGTATLVEGGDAEVGAPNVGMDGIEGSGMANGGEEPMDAEVV